MHDLRFALRQLLKSPGFTITALVTLALGIGANTSMFSVLETLMFRTPYADDAGLVRVFRTSPQSQAWPHSVANYLDHRAQNTVFEGISAVSWTSFNLAEPGQPAERLRGLNVNADFFPLLHLQPELGRFFTTDEDQPGKNAVIVLAHGAWQQRFGGDRGIVGRQIRVNGEPVTVIGVMPASADYPILWGQVEGVRPLAFSDQARKNRSNNYLNVIARLKPNVTLERAQAEMTTLAARLEKEYPQNNAQNGLRVVPLARSAQDDFGKNITVFVVGLGGFVLLIACANLANLQFARHAARARELAIRAALGASRGRLIRAVLSECLLLSLVGGALGLVVALWCNDALGRRFIFGDLSGVAISVDLRVLTFALIASVATGVAFGILPAWFSSRANVGDALKQGARGSTAGRAQHRLRHALIVGEVALALVLLSGTAFFIRGLERFTQRDAGWRTDGLVTGYLGLRGKNYTNDEQRRAFYQKLETQLAALPGVEHATFATSLPTWGFNSSTTFVVEGRPEPKAGSAPLSTIASIDPEYFATLGLRLVRGRNFTARDRADTTMVTIINEAMARALFRDENPIGKRLGDAAPFMDHPREIVGVVSDAGAAGNVGGVDTAMQMYRPIAQDPGNFLSLALRTSQSPAAVMEPLRRAIAQIDPDLPIYQIGNVHGEIDRELASLRLAGQTLGAFSLLGVLLAAVGIYGVISNYVIQRTNEIGIRIALGAQVRDILTLVLGTGLRLALLGSVLGLAGAFGVARLLQWIAPSLAGADVVSAILITLALLAVATFACWLPARRAAKVDPMTALRAE